MCGRYVSATSASKLAEEFSVDEVVVADLGERYNVAPTLDVYTIATTNEGARRMGSLRWGLVPGFAKDESISKRMINLRAETVIQRGGFTKLLDRRRCIVPADGFYEWQKPDKQPFYITSADGGPLAFAGLWDVWKPKDLRTTTLITAEPNHLVAKIHDRMVVCLPQAAWDTWLDPEVGATEAAKLLVPLPSEQMRAYPVVKLVSNVKNEGPELLEPLAGH